MQLFKRAAIFTDLHLGKKSNSAVHNQDCEDFIDWFIETAKLHNCDVGICTGDYHDNRNALNIMTLDYSMRCLEKLSNAFSQFYLIPGNHDIHYRDKRTLHSLLVGKHIDHIHIINDVRTIDEVAFFPWLVGSERSTITKQKARFAFGHFELPTFYMNARVQMPESGEIKLNHFKNFEMVYSGHFHMRQRKNNIVYIGNAFPHNFSDSGDRDRGMMILDWDGTELFIPWPKQPLYDKFKLSDLLLNAQSLLSEKHSVHAIQDVDISFEEAACIKETFISDYKLREFAFIHVNEFSETEESAEIQPNEPVDTIVADQLSTIDTSAYKIEKLIDIYNNL